MMMMIMIYYELIHLHGVFWGKIAFKLFLGGLM